MTDRIARMNDTFAKLGLGQPNAGEGNDPEMMQILQRFIFGEVFYTGDLDERTREMITVVCLTTLQALPQLKSHTAAALNVGVEPMEIREAIYQAAPFIGFPRTLNALNTINEVFTARGVALPLPSTATVAEHERFERGTEIQQPIYGDEIRDAFADLPDGLGEALPRFLTEVGFGDIASRGGLSIQQRELLILCVLAALQANRQITAHARGNLAVGNSLATQVAAMIQCLPYIGFPAAFNAIHAIMELERGTTA